MKEKVKWMLILFMLLICVFIGASWVDSAVLCGMQIVSAEQRVNLTEGLEYVENAEGIENLLNYENQSIPYDQQTNTFYVSQNMNTEDFEGSFSLCEKGIIYLDKDDYIHDKTKAISEGHSFTIWIVVEQTYMTCHLIFTGLPIVNLQTEKEISTEKQSGYFSLYNPYDEEVNQYSIKISDMLLKEAIASRTISCELYKEDYIDTKKLNLLNMGKYSEWKLYAVTEKERNPVGMMLAAYVWNTICEEEENQKLQRKYELAEVFLNGEYQGLYCMAPKVDEKFLDMDEDDFLCRIEDMENVDSIQENTNVVGYNFFLQVTGSVKNAEENFYVLYDKSADSYCKIPAKYSFCFGEFPADKGWLSMQADTYMIEDIAFEQYLWNSAISERMSILSLWNEMRQRGLSMESMLALVQKYQQTLERSGYVARSMDAEEWLQKCEQVRQYVIKRMDYLDDYYNAIGGN